MNKRTAKVSSSAWAAQILSQNPQTPAAGLSYTSCKVTDHGASTHDETSSVCGHGRAGSGVWSRLHPYADQRRGCRQVKSAAAQAGDKLADGSLTTKIQAQFFADDDVKSRYINVRTRDGVVTLKGFVESDDARRQVLEITRNTDGVKEIDDQQLLVGRPVTASFEAASTGPLPSPVATSGVVPAPSQSDPTVATLIQAKFFVDPVIKTRNIEVQAANGVVTLKGSVASETERAQALSLARSSSGVQRVEDYMVVDAGIQ